MCIKEKFDKHNIFHFIDCYENDCQIHVYNKKKQNTFLKNQRRSNYNNKPQHSKREKTIVFDKKHIKKVQ